MIEIEKKIRIFDFDAIKQLLDNQADFIDIYEKEDMYFFNVVNRKPDYSLDKVFRLRKYRGKSVVTFKRKSIIDRGEVNHEIEFLVDSSDQFIKFAKYLGFVPYIKKNKKSYVYRWKELTIELAYIDYLGWFLEVEKLVVEEKQIIQAIKEIDAFFNDIIKANSSEKIEYIEDYYIEMIEKKREK